MTLNESKCYNCNNPVAYDDISMSRENPSLAEIMDYASLARMLKMGVFQDRIIGEDKSEKGA